MYGPFSETLQEYDTYSPPRRFFRRSSTWYRTGKKGRHSGVPTPYNVVQNVNSGGSFGYFDVGNSLSSFVVQNASDYNDSDDGVMNRCLEKFVANVKDKWEATLAATAAEWDQSGRMIEQRALQLLQAARSLRRGDWRGFAGALSLNAGDKRKSRRFIKDPLKDFADVWLEFHFGWVPLAQDIYNACQALGSQPPSGKTCGRGMHSLGVAYDGRHPDGSGRTVALNYQCYGLVQANVYVDNPNVALLNQLGIINPASVAWELVPYSFVVDWFANVGDYLNSFTWLLGYDVRQPFHTFYRVASSAEVYYPAIIISEDPTAGCFASSYAVVRTLGLPPYKLILPQMPNGVSVTRAATAISLLLQKMV